MKTLALHKPQSDSWDTHTGLLANETQRLGARSTGSPHPSPGCLQSRGRGWRWGTQHTLIGVGEGRLMLPTEPRKHSAEPAAAE